MQVTKIYGYSEVREIHLEVTTLCNASCPMCARNHSGGALNANIPKAELTLADLKSILPTDFIKQLTLAYACGNYGDPMLGRDTQRIFEHLRYVNPSIKLGMYSNGGARSPKWWSKLATVIDFCQFGIDGLDTTSHLYRRGTNWRKVIRNATAFIEAGGNAEWEFLAFRHNESEIDQAAQLAKALGFRKFRVRRTNRFLRSGSEIDQFPVKNQAGQIEYYLEPPQNPTLRNPGAARISALAMGQDAVEKFYAEAVVECQASELKRVFLTAEGLVFPCCYVGHIYHRTTSPQDHDVWRLLSAVGNGTESVDPRRASLRDVIEGKFFEAVANSWARDTGGSNKLRICADLCGTCKPLNSMYTKSLI